MNNKIYDFAGVGIGPFNLGLACLTKPIGGLNGIFLDRSASFNWHPGMLLQDTTLQVPFMADLVTMADPCSPFSFLNYLKEQGRLYAFYIRENFLVLRNEYNMYCQWVCKQLDNLHFNTNVQSITYNKELDSYQLEVTDLKTNETSLIYAKKLVLGTGTTPYIPNCCLHLKDYASHSSDYLNQKAALQQKKSITIVGSGQSAAEIFYDLLQEIEIYGYSLHWITRSPRFFPLEYGKLTLEMTSPEYVDYFYDLPSETRDQVVSEQKQLYKGINLDLINAIHDLIYTKKLSHNVTIGLQTNCDLKNATLIPENGRLCLDFHQHQQDKHFQHETEGLVMATGYQYQTPEFIDGIKHNIKWDDKGRFDVHRNYSIDRSGKNIFVQNAELHTHGFVTPDLGMGAYRNAYIINEMMGIGYYKVEQKTTFQQFGSPVKQNEPVFQLN